MVEGKHQGLPRLLLGAFCAEQIIRHPITSAQSLSQTHALSGKGRLLVWGVAFFSSDEGPQAP